MNILKHCSEGLTLFLGFLALLAFAPSASATTLESPSVALHVEMSETGEQVTETQIVVVPGRTYAVELPGLDTFQLKITVAADTRTAVYEAFERDLGRSARDFVFVDTELWRSEYDDAGKLAWVIAADSDVLLSLTGRPISVDASIDGGDRILRVSAVPFEG